VKFRATVRNFTQQKRQVPLCRRPETPRVQSASISDRPVGID